jgi:hypothetical protein
LAVIYLIYNQWGRLSSETLLQTGWDSNCGVSASLGCSSSSGLAQLRYRLSRKFYALGRYEGTNVIQHAPLTTHTMNIQVTVAH